MGLFISGTGLYFNLVSLVGEKNFALFHEDTCREGARFWGNDMWNPNLEANTTAYQTLVIGCCLQGNTIPTGGEWVGTRPTGLGHGREHSLSHIGSTMRQCFPHPGIR